MAEGFPKWAVEEIANVDWQYFETWKNSGYILDLDRNGRRIDVQFYDKLPEGRYIATLDVPEGHDLDKFELGSVYLFYFKVFRAQLSQRLSEYILKEYAVNMDYLYRFELLSIEKVE